MNEKEKIILFDFLINNIENSEMFDIDNILTKHKKASDEIIRDYVNDLNSFGIKNNIFEKVGNDNRTSWLRLTPKGEKLKLFKKGFVNFENKSTKTPLTLYQKIYLPVFIFSVACSVILGFSTYNLNTNNNRLNGDNHKLNDSINRLNKIIESKTIKSLNDTLRTKILNH